MRKEEKTAPPIEAARTHVKEYISEVISHLDKTKILSPLDSMPISILTTQLNVFAEAAACIQAEGLLVLDDKENLVANPKIAIMNQAETMALKIMKEYGLMPKARKELGKTAEPKKKSPLEAFLEK
jgi:P27 family predicted phage terminase small subunit